MAFDDEELTFIEASTPAWGEALYMEGICKPAREAASTPTSRPASLRRLAGPGGPVSAAR